RSLKSAQYLICKAAPHTRSAKPNLYPKMVAASRSNSVIRYQVKGVSIPVTRGEIDLKVSGADYIGLHHGQHPGVIPCHDDLGLLVVENNGNKTAAPTSWCLQRGKLNI